MFSQAGKVGPGYCTGVGKAMLAFLSEEAREVALSQQAWFAHTAHTHTTRHSLPFCRISPLSIGSTNATLFFFFLFHDDHHLNLSMCSSSLHERTLLCFFLTSLTL